MTSLLIKAELARVARVRRAMPFVWGLVVLWGVSAALKTRRVVQIALAFGLSRQEAIGLITMSNSSRITKSFPGYAMVFYDLAISSFGYAMAFCLGVFGLSLRAAALRRQTAILQYAQELEQAREGRVASFGTDRKD